MSVVSMKQLLEAGVHFGHQTRRWNPKMATVHLHRAQRDLHHRPAEDGQEAGRSLFLRARPGGQWREPSCSSAPRSRRRTPSRRKQSAVGQFYVNARWLGGMLTNFTHHAHPDRPSGAAAQDGRGRHLCHAAQEGSYQASGRDRQAGKVSRRRQGHEAVCPALCSSLTPARRETPSPKLASCISPSSPSSIPTAIRTRSTMSSPATMTPSAPSA